MISETYNEDCMDGMAHYPDKWFDLAVVDPPYGIGQPKQANLKGYEGRPSLQNRLNRGSGKLKNGILNSSNCDWDNSPPSMEYFTELFRISKNQIIWGGNYFTLPATRGFAIWDKEQPFDNFSGCEFAWTSFDCPAKIKRIPTTRTGEDKIHPTQKPVALFSWIYANYLPKGGKVIDTHLGSGSNRIAADKAGNIDFYGWEIDKDYFEAQEKRFKQFKSQLTIKYE